MRSGWRIDLVEIDDREWDVYFGPPRLGRFHGRTLLIEDGSAVDTGGSTECQ